MKYVINTLAVIGLYFSIVTTLAVLGLPILTAMFFGQIVVFTVLVWVIGVWATRRFIGGKNVQH